MRKCWPRASNLLAALIVFAIAASGPVGAKAKRTVPKYTTNEVRFANRAWQLHGHPGEVSPSAMIAPGVRLGKGICTNIRSVGIFDEITILESNGNKYAVLLVDAATLFMCPDQKNNFEGAAIKKTTSCYKVPVAVGGYRVVCPTTTTLNLHGPRVVYGPNATGPSDPDP